MAAPQHASTLMSGWKFGIGVVEDGVNPQVISVGEEGNVMIGVGQSVFVTSNGQADCIKQGKSKVNYPRAFLSKVHKYLSKVSGLMAMKLQCF